MASRATVIQSVYMLVFVSAFFCRRTGHLKTTFRLEFLRWFARVYMAVFRRTLECLLTGWNTAHNRWNRQQFHSGLFGKILYIHGPRIRLLVSSNSVSETTSAGGERQRLILTILLPNLEEVNLNSTREYDFRKRDKTMDHIWFPDLFGSKGSPVRFFPGGKLDRPVLCSSGLENTTTLICSFPVIFGVPLFLSQDSVNLFAEEKFLCQIYFGI